MTNLVDFVRAADGNGAVLENYEIFSKASQIVTSVSDYYSRRGPLTSDHEIRTREAIGDCAERYQTKLSRIVQDNEVAEEARSRIQLLKEDKQTRPVLLLMSSHQPNLFAYSGVMKKIILLACIEQILRTKWLEESYHGDVVCFYGFADHDFVHNKWVRSAEIVSPIRRDGLLRYSVKIDQKQMYLPTNRIQKPNEELLESWQAQTKGWISENLSLAKKYLRGRQNTSIDLNALYEAYGNSEDFWNLVRRAHDIADNLAEFSSLLLSAVAQEKWKLPIVFANFSDCFKFFPNEYLWLLQNRETFKAKVEDNEAKMKLHGIDTGLANDIGEVSPLWLKCECGSKYRLELKSDAVIGRCARCSSDLSLTFAELESLVAENPERIEPRSIAMPIVFSKAVGMSCYVGGIGSLGYLMHSASVSAALKVMFPPTPFWYSEDEFMSLQRLAAYAEIDRMRDTYLPKSTDSDLDPLGLARAIQTRLAGPIDSSVDRKPAELERDRQLLGRILSKNGYGTTSCMIDYAVNVSLEKSGEQWLRFLLSDGKLLASIHMTSVYEFHGQQASM